MYIQKQQKNKYMNVPTEYGGAKYHSKKESIKAYELDLLVKAGEIESWKKQVKIELYGVNGTKICNYFCDFLVHHKGGVKEYIEIKSPITATDAWKLKWHLTEDLFKYEISRGEVILTVEY